MRPRQCPKPALCSQWLTHDALAAMRARLDRELDDVRGDVVGHRRRQRPAPAAAPLRLERRNGRLDGRPVPGRIELRLAHDVVSCRLRARGIALPGRARNSADSRRVRPTPGRRGSPTSLPSTARSPPSMPTVAACERSPRATARPAGGADGTLLERPHPCAARAASRRRSQPPARQQSEGVVEWRRPAPSG